MLRPGVDGHIQAHLKSGKKFPRNLTRLVFFFFIGELLLYNIVMDFAIHQYESVISIPCPSILNPPPTALSTPSL